MEDQIDKLSELNRYQIAGLAIAGSTVAALGVVVLLRRFGLFSSSVTTFENEAVAQPAVSTSSAPGIPAHFSEDLLVPGLTHTGPEIQQDEDRNGRSPEGV